MTAAADAAALLEQLSDRSDRERFGPLAEPMEPHDATATLEAGPTPVRVLGPTRAPRASSERFALVRVEGEDRPHWIAACRLPDAGEPDRATHGPNAMGSARATSGHDVGEGSHDGNGAAVSIRSSCARPCDDERGSFGGD